ncbi:MAG: hypothetical protein IPJ23_11650 [Ignavibacteriales bacterium]|nr:hypothetical protein [Ignavibacteriales bacterium]
MINNFSNIAGVIKISLRFIVLLLLCQSVAYSQTKSNLNQFYTLIDSASSQLLKDLGDAKKVNLELNFGTDYSVFANQVRGKLLRNNIQLVGDNSEDKNFVRVNFVVDNSFVCYTEPEKDGIFGDFYTERTIEISGNYFISNNPQVKDFKLAVTDTINVEDVENLENRSYPFTRGELPPEPFFSSLLEPIVAIGAAAVTVILFFTVRSK